MIISKFIILNFYFFLFGLQLFSQATNKNDTIKVLTARNYGRGFSFDDIISSFYTDTSGIDKRFIPSDILHYVFKVVHFNYPQYYYNVARKNRTKIDSSIFKWYFDYEHYDTALLTAEKINEDVLIFYGLSRDSSKVLVVDCNNNKRFDDDPIIRMPRNQDGIDPHLPILHISNIEYPGRKGRMNKDYFIKLDPYTMDGYAGSREDFFFWRVSFSSFEFKEGFMLQGGKNYRVRFFQRLFRMVNANLPTDYLILPADEPVPTDISSSKICKAGDTIAVNGSLFSPIGKSAFGDTLFIKSCGPDTFSSGIRMGNIAKDFIKRDIAGNNIQLSEIVNDKFVLLDFWGTWCKPCIAGIPALKEIYEKLKETGKVQFISIAFDKSDSINAVKRIINNYKMNWIHIVDGPGNSALIADLYKVNEFPSIYLLAPGGKILNMAIGKQEIDKLLELLQHLVLN